MLLAGCAAQRAILTPEVAQQMNAMELCTGTLYFRPENAATAQAEARRRGLDCAPLYPGIQAQTQSRQAAAEAMFSRPTYTPPQSNTMNCTTQRIGTLLQTNCN